MTKLNETQLEIVNHGVGPLLVAAVPGAGKTRCIVERIKKLIDDGEDRSGILAVTFTNKATKEMQERLERDNYPIGQMTISTFHSFCVGVLRKCGGLLGYDQHFNIYDDKDQKANMKHVLKDLGYLKTKKAVKELENTGIDKPLFEVDEMVNASEKIKNSLLTDDEINEKYLPEHVEVVNNYNEKLKTNNAMDFTGLLYNTYVLFEKFPKIAEYYSKKFRHILVDEVQDTNKAQYALITHLMKVNNNIVLVGDEDQSIYGWRCAEPQNIKKFIRDFNPKVVKLEWNYRSASVILETAQKLIEHNKDRIQKELKTEIAGSGLVKLIESNDNKTESTTVCRIMQKLMAEKGLEWKDFAILYRTNVVSHEFEEMCRMNQIPYKVYGGFGFYDRAEVKTFLSYMKFLSNPKDAIAFTSCVNVPSRGVGEVAQAKVWKESFRTGRTILDICLDPPTTGPNKLTKKQAEGIKTFADAFDGVNFDNPAPHVRAMCEQSGIIGYYANKDKIDNTNRAENVLELVDSFEYWAKKKENPIISNYLQEVSLMSEEEEEIDDNHVRLMTMHSAKGLEFPCVFVVAAEENTLPHKRSIEEGNVEEERRLAYVAMTRAEKYLLITTAKTRWKYGEMQKTMPSRFLFECGLKEAIENEELSTL